MNKIKKLYDEQGLKKTREILVQKADEYINDFIQLLKEDAYFALPFGRCFYHFAEVKKRINDIFNNESEIFLLRVQSMYEILDAENSISRNLKNIYKDFLIQNIKEYEKAIKEAYFETLGYNYEKYFEVLKNKISNTNTQKKWVYLFEIALIYKDKKETEIIIDNYISNNGSFTEECAKYLKENLLKR